MRSADPLGAEPVGTCLYFSLPYTSLSLTPSQGPNISPNHAYLYDLQTTLQPTRHTSILEVLEDKSAPTTLYPSSSILLLAHIQVISPPSPRPHRSHSRQNPDDLIRDLELALGSTTTVTTPYLAARVSYRHPLFPDRFSSDTCAAQTTRLETTCTASIATTTSADDDDDGSLWSPRCRRPAAAAARQQRRVLLDIVASHWGVRAAGEVERRMTPLPPSSARARAGTVRGGGYVAGPRPPVVPRRKASLRQTSSVALAEGKGGGEEEDGDGEDESGHDAARKIWTEIRRMSSVGSGGGERDRKVSAASSGMWEVDRRREAVRERALRNRRSVGADTLRSLVPTVAEVNTNANNTCGARDTDDETTPKRLVAAPKIEGVGGRAETMNGRAKGKENVDSMNGRGKGKENMRWSWTGWWQ